MWYLVALKCLKMNIKSNVLVLSSSPVHPWVQLLRCFDKLSNRSMVPLKYVLCTMTMHYAV